MRSTIADYHREAFDIGMQKDLSRTIGRVLLLTVVFSAAAVYEAGHVSAFSSGDIWWHLRTGLWMVENHSIPRTGLFSQYPNWPWSDANWGYQVILAAGYKLFDLKAIPLLLMGFKVALAVVTFLLARAGRASFLGAVFLSAVAQYVMPGLQPLPSVFSILFFAIGLRWLLQARWSGEVRGLYWLPLLFVVWANLDLQFVIGLALLVLFVVGVAVEQLLRARQVSWLSDRIQPLPLGRVGMVTGLSIVATLVTPYPLKLLPSAFETLYSEVGFVHFDEMSAMKFHQPQDYVLMLLVMVAFLALGRRRSVDPFLLLALLGGTLLAFRVQRDAWVAVLPAVAIIGSNFLEESDEVSAGRLPRWASGLAAIVVAIVFLVAALRLPDRNALMSKISHSFPVKASDFIVQNRLPEPIFNAYVWGGFMTWYMPQYPVVMDNRVALYGNDILARYFDVTSGKELLESEPTVARAHTLLLERKSAMAKALMSLPKLSAEYKLVYSDDLACVFVTRVSSQ